jgi:hypothetical protein
MVTIMSGRECMTRSEGRQRERASAAEYRPRLKIGRIEAVPADGDGPVDHAAKTMAHARLERDQARTGKVS